MTDRKIKNGVLLLVLVALVALAGCSCKEYEEQIMQLDAQIAELQQDLSDRDAVISERERVAEDLRANLAECKDENAVLVEELEEVVMISVPDQLSFSASQVIVLDTMVPTLEAIAATVRQHENWDVFVEGFRPGVMKRLGAEAAYLGCVGDDFLGDIVRDALAAEEVDCSHLRRAPGGNFGAARLGPGAFPDRSHAGRRHGCGAGGRGRRRLRLSGQPLSRRMGGRSECGRRCGHRGQAGRGRVRRFSDPGQGAR